LLEPDFEYGYFIYVYSLKSGNQKSQFYFIFHISEKNNSLNGKNLPKEKKRKEKKKKTLIWRAP